MSERFLIVVSETGPQGPAGNGSVSSSLGWYSVKDYGALGNNSNDDTSAIQAAIDAMPADGGVLYFPTGSWKCSGSISIEGRRNIIFQGTGGRSAGAQTGSLLYTNMTGSGRFINVRSSSGVQFRDLEIGYTSGSYTGTLIDASLTSSDTNHLTFSNCLIAGLAVSSALLIDLDKAIFVSFEDCSFAGADIAIRGAAGSSSFSNRVSFSGCNFGVVATVAVRNPSGAWSFTGCSWDMSSVTAKGMDHDSGVLCQGLLVQGCWTGDTTGGGTVFKVAGHGIAFIGNYIGCSGGTGINADAAVSGFLVQANRFDSCTNAVTMSASNDGTMIFGNSYVGVTNKLGGAGTGSLGSGAIYNDGSGSATGLRIYQQQSDGITMTDGANVIAQGTTGTKIGTGSTQKLGFWNATPVVRPTGWGAPTGTATRTVYDTNTVTLVQLAERLKGLIDDLTTIGLIGS